MDVGDDGIRRFVVRHYRFDPTRRERRHVVVAAFDNKREFEACLSEVDAEITKRQAAGERVEPNEHASGTVRDVGADRSAANGHLLRRAMEHGVAPGQWLDELELPPNMALMLRPNMVLMLRPNMALMPGGDESAVGWRDRIRRLIWRRRPPGRS